MTASGNPSDCVDGTVFTVTNIELEIADKYEVDDYHRVLVPLQSGVHAWVYVSAAPTR